jgi:hypothetical protein
MKMNFTSDHQMYLPYLQSMYHDFSMLYAHWLRSRPPRFVLLNLLAPAHIISLTFIFDATIVFH